MFEYADICMHCFKLLLINLTNELKLCVLSIRRFLSNLLKDIYNLNYILHWTNNWGDPTRLYQELLTYQNTHRFGV